MRRHLARNASALPPRNSGARVATRCTQRAGVCLDRARRQRRGQRDIDLLVDVEAGRTLLDVIALAQDLEQLLGQGVNVLTTAASAPTFSNRSSRKPPHCEERPPLPPALRTRSGTSSYTSPGRDPFLSDRMRQDATLRKLEVIGQAVRNLSDDCKSREPSNVQLGLAR